MIIYIQGKEVETRHILKISEAGFRRHGFEIHLIDGKIVSITEKQNYDSTNLTLAGINDRYRALREKVEEKWKEDKVDYTSLYL